MEIGDISILPMGIYHGFTLDEQKYGKFRWLLVGELVYEPAS